MTLVPIRSSITIGADFLDKAFAAEIATNIAFTSIYTPCSIFAVVDLFLGGQELNLRPLTSVLSDKTTKLPFFIFSALSYS